MRYDRLLQLAGVERKVTIPPPYISKEELKRWQDDQEKEIPNGEIKGVKEIEDFLGRNSDNADLVDVLNGVANALKGSSGDTKDSQTIYGAKAYADYVVGQVRTETVYVASGQSEGDLVITPTVISQLQETLVELSMFDDYIYVLYPKTRGVVITMSSIEVPFTKIGEETIEGVDFNIYRSRNTYSGEYKIALLLKY